MKPMYCGKFSKHYIQLNSLKYGLYFSVTTSRVIHQSPLCIPSPMEFTEGSINHSCKHQLDPGDPINTSPIPPINQTFVGFTPHTLQDYMEYCVWSCLVTIFSCTWVGMHPNIPCPRKKEANNVKPSMCELDFSEGYSSYARGFTRVEMRWYLW